MDPNLILLTVALAGVLLWDNWSSIGPTDSRARRRGGKLRGRRKAGRSC